MLIDYVDEIFKTAIDAIREKKLDSAIKELEESAPQAMNTMLDKQPREEAIEKKKFRERMPVLPVPPTNPGRKELSVINPYQ